MKTVYIRDSKETSLFKQAEVGFIKMGYNVLLYKNFPSDITRDDVVIGYISDVFTALKTLDIPLPEALDYPEELKSYFGREIGETNLDYIINNPQIYPIFIKPKKHKLFNGVVVREFKDLIGVSDVEMWCSKPVNILTEYRAYINDNKIVGLKHYKGNPYLALDISKVVGAMQTWKSSPISYSIDFGLTEEGETIVIEVNDGFGLGNYGLNEIDYAKLLLARYEELVLEC